MMGGIPGEHISKRAGRAPWLPGRSPEVEKVFECYAHRNVITRPPEDAHAVHHIRSGPDDDVPEFIPAAAQLLDKCNVNRNTLVFPPHIGHIDHTMRFRSQEWQETLEDVTHAL